MMQDLRLGARALRRTPGFTLAAVASLALGLALTASTLAVVNAYLLRAIPFPSVHRLYHVVYSPVGQPEPHGLTTLDWHAALGDVIDVADSSTPARLYLTNEGSIEEAAGISIARGSADGLGVHAILGRTLEDQDYRPDAERVAMIGHSLWRTRFGSDPQVVGRILHARQSSFADPIQAYRIIGVLPPGFRFVREYSRGVADIVIPLTRPLRTYFVRLREGVPITVAEQRITAVVKAASTMTPPNWTGVRLESVHDRYVAGLRPILVALTAAAVLVIGIVCANVGVLVLLRAMRRQQEMSARIALGAGRTHIVRMLVAETCLLCGAALAIGLALTALTLRLLAPLIEAQLGRPPIGGESAMTIDPTVLAGVSGVGVLLALSLAAVPLLTPWQRRLADALRREGRTGTDGPSMRRLRAGLIAIEVAGSLALLVGCGLMIRTVVHLVRTDLGYRTDGIVRVRIALPAPTYPDTDTFMRFYDRFSARLTDAMAQRGGDGSPFAIVNHIPFYPAPRQAIDTDGGEGRGVTAGVLAVSEGYFSLLQIPLVRGRAFTADDREGFPPVAIISETLARRLWPDGSALGRRLRTAAEPVPNSPLTSWRTIVGITRDVRQTYTDTDLSDIYLPFAQAPSRYAPLYARADRPAAAWLERMQQIGKEIDPHVMISLPGVLSVQADELLSGPRFVMSILTGFATFAALLAMLGIYGVTAYAVQQRGREVAIRMALGASGPAVVRMFLRENIGVLAAGVIGGLLGAVAVARLLEHQLFGVRPMDAITMTAMCGLMAIAATVATWWPARRATIRNPVAALRDQ